MYPAHIAIFASAFYPSLGGVEELVRQLAHAYRKRGVKAIVFTNRWPRDLPRHEVYEGIDIYRLAMRIPEGSTKAHLTRAPSSATCWPFCASTISRCCTCNA